MNSKIEVVVMDSRTYRGVTYWCSSDGLCELPLDSGSACGSEDLLKDMIVLLDLFKEIPHKDDKQNGVDRQKDEHCEKKGSHHGASSSGKTGDSQNTLPSL